MSNNGKPPDARGPGKESESMNARLRISLSLWLLQLAAGDSWSAECDAWQTRRPDWIFCDDFEKGGALVAQDRYFEYDNNKGDFNTASGTGYQGSMGMRAIFQTGEVEAGNLKLGFGRSPSAYFSKGIRSDSDFREVYYRMFVRLQKGWKGNPYKLSRATVMAKTDWSQAMIAHLWGDEAERLKLDPVSCTDASGTVKCAGYNDFDNMKWLGAKAGLSPLFNGTYEEKWVCVETHVRLNDAGEANGIHEFWVDDKLEARREGLDFVGSYKAYGINAVFFENHWNSGSPVLQERFFDNIVVSTRKIGCKEEPSAPPAGIPGRTDRGFLEDGNSGILGFPSFGSDSVLGPFWSIHGKRGLGRSGSPAILSKKPLSAPVAGR